MNVIVPTFPIIHGILTVDWNKIKVSFASLSFPAVYISSRKSEYYFIECLNCRYRGCEPLVLSCPSCSGTFGCSPILTSVCAHINTKPDDVQAGSTNNFWQKLCCPKCPEGDGGQMSPAIIANQVFFFLCVYVCLSRYICENGNFKDYLGLF